MTYSFAPSSTVPMRDGSSSIDEDELDPPHSSPNRALSDPDNNVVVTEAVSPVDFGRRGGRDEGNSGRTNDSKGLDDSLMSWSLLDDSTSSMFERI